MEKPNSADIALYCAAIWSAIGLYHYIMGNTHTLEGLIRMLVGISASLGWKSESKADFFELVMGKSLGVVGMTIVAVCGKRVHSVRLQFADESHGDLGPQGCSRFRGLWQSLVLLHAANHLEPGSESLRSKAGFRFEQQEGVRQQLLDGVQSGGRCFIHFPYSRKLI